MVWQALGSQEKRLKTDSLGLILKTPSDPRNKRSLEIFPSENLSALRWDLSHFGNLFNFPVFSYRGWYSAAGHFCFPTILFLPPRILSIPIGINLIKLEIKVQLPALRFHYSHLLAGWPCCFTSLPCPSASHPAPVN